MSNNDQNSERHSPPRRSGPGAPLKVGDLVTGRIAKIAGEVAFVDFGHTVQGYVQLSELRDENGNLTVREGDSIEAEVVGTRGAVHLSHRKARAAQHAEALRETFEAKRPVAGRVVGVNRGGFEVDLDGVRAFCPSSQIADRFVKDPTRFVGRTYDFLITDFADGKRPVVSRRAILEAEKAEARQALADHLTPGAVLQGKITRLADFGVFVDVGGGVEGLVHISELSHERVKHPREVVREGEAVEVRVLRYDPENDRISLSMKALREDPWTQFARGLEPGQRLTGTVARLQPFGAFVNLAPGVDGLLHVSAIKADERIDHPEQVLKEGDEVEVVVDKVDLARQRIGLVTPEVAEKRAAPAFRVEPGQVLTGKVAKVERFGVFVELGPKATGLVPNAEMDTPRGADHAKMFPVGTEIEVKVLEVDPKRNRIRLSRRALKADEEQAAMREYRQKENVPQSLGTFGDLLKDFLEKNK